MKERILLLCSALSLLKCVGLEWWRCVVFLSNNGGPVEHSSCVSYEGNGITGCWFIWWSTCWRLMTGFVWESRLKSLNSPSKPSKKLDNICEFSFSCWFRINSESIVEKVVVSWWWFNTDSSPSPLSLSSAHSRSQFSFQSASPNSSISSSKRSISGLSSSLSSGWSWSGEKRTSLFYLKPFVNATSTELMPTRKHSNRLLLE